MIYALIAIWVGHIGSCLLMQKWFDPTLTVGMTMGTLYGWWGASTAFKRGRKKS